MRAIAIILIIAICSVGCAAVPEPQIITKTVYQDVYLPTPCDEKIPPRPLATGSAELMLIDTLEWAAIIEVKLRICTGEL